MADMTKDETQAVNDALDRLDAEDVKEIDKESAARNSAEYDKYWEKDEHGVSHPK